MYCVYMIVNEKGRTYVGYTSNLSRRLEQHNAGENVSTKGHTWKLAYAEAYLVRSDAEKREKALKKHGKSLYHIKSRACDSIKVAECWEGVAEGGIDD